MLFFSQAGRNSPRLPLGTALTSLCLLPACWPSWAHTGHPILSALARPRLNTLALWCVVLFVCFFVCCFVFTASTCCPQREPPVPGATVSFFPTTCQGERPGLGRPRCRSASVLGIRTTLGFSGRCPGLPVSAPAPGEAWLLQPASSCSPSCRSLLNYSY